MSYVVTVRAAKENVMQLVFINLC